MLLGAGTCQLEPGRATTAALVEVESARWVYDFGRRTADRLVELGLRQDDVGHVVLSHFHTDHWSDLLPYLQAASHSPSDARSIDLEIHATPEVVAKLERLFALFETGELVAQERFRVRLRPVAGDRLAIGGQAIDFVDLPPAGNRGIRFRAGEKLCALTGDSHFHRQEIDFLRGADLAVIDSGHLTDDEIVELARVTGVPRLICSHLYRRIDVDRLQRRAAAAGYPGRLSVARDLDVVEL